MDKEKMASISRAIISKKAQYVRDRRRFSFWALHTNSKSLTSPNVIRLSYLGQSAPLFRNSLLWREHRTYDDYSKNGRKRFPRARSKIGVAAGLNSGRSSNLYTTMESASPFFSDQPRDAFGAILQDQAGTLPSGEAILSSEPDVDQRSHSRVASHHKKRQRQCIVSNSLGNPSLGEIL